MALRSGVAGVGHIVRSSPVSASGPTESSWVVTASAGTAARLLLDVAGAPFGASFDRDHRFGRSTMGPFRTTARRRARRGTRIRRDHEREIR
jgi:hypothetical protein